MEFAYPKLYRRTALYIGLALFAFIVIGAASVAAIAARELSNYSETRHSGLGREAAFVLADGGEPALKKWLEYEASIPENVSVFILNSEGTDLLGQKIPATFEDFVRTSVVGAPEAPDSYYEPVHLAPIIFDKQGNKYSFLVMPKNISIWGNVATITGIVVTALLIVSIVAWAIAGTFGRPIGEIQSAVRNLTAGDTSARVPLSITERDDELGNLAVDFNAMADRLNRLINNRERLMRELSHELRSPLTRLQAALALADAHQRLNEKERTRIDAEIGQMNKVIGEILRYSRLDTSVQMQMRLVRIDKLLKRVVDVEEVEAATKDCALYLSTENNLAVAGDPEMLQSAFENILRNAIRHSPDGSRIEINAARKNSAKGAFIIVKIRDYGPGISADLLEHIFEPYVRANPANYNISSGLGLAIVKRVVERHRGTVNAEICEDGGLQMICRIPAADLV